MIEVSAESSFLGSDRCLKEEMSFLASTILRWTSSMMEMVGLSLATGVGASFVDEKLCDSFYSGNLS
jgi:hypothetical protein